MDFQAHVPHDIEDTAGRYRKTIDSAKRDVLIPILTELCERITDNIDENRALLTVLTKRKGTWRKPELLQLYQEEVESGNLMYNRHVMNTLTKKTGKSDSGIVSITLVTSPGRFSCPQDCHYCPNEPNMPRSYVSTGPSLLRAIRVDFDVVRQFRERAFTLASMGHDITKIEIIVIGGTWSYHPVSYQEEFITGLYYAANTFTDKEKRECKSLDEELKINETAGARIIGITLETRPDQIVDYQGRANKAELERFRRYGVTRVQLGVQHINDRILEYINRKCTTFIAECAIRVLKQNGFKVDAHFMPDLPGSDYLTDLEMFTWLFSTSNETLQADQLKIYPTMTTQFTKILEWYKSGQYVPYSDQEDGKYLFDLIVYITTHVPRWIRLNRVVRDIPGTVIEGKFKETNLYQRVLKHMQDNNLKGQDIRFREVKLETFTHDECQIIVNSYRSSEGTEYFISYEADNGNKLLGFARLRFNDDKMSPHFPELKGCALLRELHVYGKMVRQNAHSASSQHMGETSQHIGETSQHMGIGKLLMKKVEEIAIANNYSKIAVISGTGVREYYRKRGYHLEGSYMVKSLGNYYSYKPVYALLAGIALFAGTIAIYKRYNRV